MQGGVVVLYFEENRSVPCIASIVDVEEKEEQFTFQIFGWQGSKKRTYFDTGRNMKAKADKVWRMVHRTEFERDCTSLDIRKGQVIRVRLQS